MYEEIQANLSKDNPQQIVLARFIGLIQKHFPTLIAFLRKIKRSTLEKLQVKSINLHPSLNFVHSLLEKGIEDEMSILRVLEEYQRQKLSRIGKKILNQVVKSFMMFNSNIKFCCIIFFLENRESNCAAKVVAALGERQFMLYHLWLCPGLMLFMRNCILLVSKPIPVCRHPI